MRLSPKSIGCERFPEDSKAAIDGNIIGLWKPLQ
jgi:hypothetical protein